MIEFNYRNTDSVVIGEENGLNIEQEFLNYKDRIAQIITDLNKRKDKPGQWLQWMNLGYNGETVWISCNRGSVKTILESFVIRTKK